MITSPAWSGKRYAVLGLARSGLATVEALVASGAHVVAWDSNEERRSEILSRRERGTSEAGGEGLSTSEGLAFAANPSPPPLRGGPPLPPGEEL